MQHPVIPSSGGHRIIIMSLGYLQLTGLSKRGRMAELEHTITAFGSELQALSRRIAEMGGLVERQVLEAIEALSKGDQERGRRVVAADTTIDHMQREIDEAVVTLIARLHPVAVDLRQAVAILRI